MKTQRLFFFLSFVVLIAICGVVVHKLIPAEEIELFLTDGTIPQTIAVRIGTARRVKITQESDLGDQTSDFDQELLDTADGGITTFPTDSAGSEDGTNESTPANDLVSMDSSNELSTFAQNEEGLIEWGSMTNSLASLKKIDSIPWELSQVERAFNSSSQGACRILPGGQEAEIFPELVGSGDQQITRFRIPVATVGLRLSSQADSIFSGVAAGEVKKHVQGYLSGHKLVLQAQVIKNEDDRATFSGPLIAAFIPSKGPTVTVSPQKLVSEAVDNIRFIGALHNQTDGIPTVDTLIFAFKYQRSPLSGTTVSDIKINDYEILIFHLVKEPILLSTTPKIAIFATTDGRTKIHKLTDLHQRSRSNPNISSDISFSTYSTVGGPASPYSVSIKPDSSSEISTDLIKNRLAGTSQFDAIPLSEMLNEMALSN